MAQLSRRINALTHLATQMDKQSGFMNVMGKEEIRYIILLPSMSWILLKNFISPLLLSCSLLKKPRFSVIYDILADLLTVDSSLEFFYKKMIYLGDANLESEATPLTSSIIIFRSFDDFVFSAHHPVLILQL